ncbi:hypothetical protein ZWY2020_050704 [Hordeum vulgare]|nr:hypothetical protein ZWY2020_050704 [Hordeum vulgare]
MVVPSPPRPRRRRGAPLHWRRAYVRRAEAARGGSSAAGRFVAATARTGRLAVADEGSPLDWTKGRRGAATDHGRRRRAARLFGGKDGTRTGPCGCVGRAEETARRPEARGPRRRWGEAPA